MKPLNTAICLVIAAMPICSTAQTTLSTSQPIQQEDSIFVRAAKLANSAPKKATIVITNETLLRSGGHIAIASQSVAQVPTTQSSAAASQPAPQRQQQQSAPATNNNSGKAPVSPALPTYTPTTIPTMPVGSPTTAPPAKPPLG